jgi:UDP-N-acetylglucosamine 2-epimerase (non-hydrolysing)
MGMSEKVAPGSSPKVLVVVGTRPEAIKMAPVVRALRERGEQVSSRLALTGQHDELVGQVLDVFGLEPSYDLGIMRPGQDLYDVAQACMNGLKSVIRDYQPELILVQGDTASVFFSAVGAFFEKVGVGHVEAGLRSRHPATPYPDPYPEEMFRRLTGVLTLLHFAPTPLARSNLLAEGIPGDRVHVTGNTVVDALLEVSKVPHVPANRELKGVLEGRRRLVLLTAHRRESFGEPLRKVFATVRELVDQDSTLEVLYPVHPNPNVMGPAQELLSGHPRVHLTDPLSYLDMVAALRAASLVLTDSGGIQEEAPTFGTPVLVLRDATERPEGVDAGSTRLVGTDPARILAEAKDVLGQASGGVRDGGSPSPFGDGAAGPRIADIAVSHLTGLPRETTDWDGV